MHFELHEKQLTTLESEANEILYGGAAGGGKSHLIRVASIILCKMIPGFNFYLFRRKSNDLKKNHLYGAGGYYKLLEDEIQKKLVRIYENENQIKFKNGSKIFLCHCQYEKNMYDYQGAEIHGLGIDELTHFTETIYKFLRGRCRLGDLNIPGPAKQFFKNFPLILCGSNPGNLGHNWVKRNFIDIQPFMDISRMEKKEGGMLRQYIPALLSDNPTLLENDPDYMDRLEGLGSPELIEAMKNGNWDITAGGAIDDLWRRDTHVIQPFKIPSSWTIDRGYDWGSAKPGACIWFAESNGEEIELNGKIKYFPPGTIIAIRELYFWNGKENEGSKLNATEHAKQIKQIDNEFLEVGLKVNPGPADNAIYSVENDNCIADDMEKVGIRWVKSNKAPGSRVQGLEKLRDYLKNSIKDPLEKPGFYVFNTCTQIIRTLPTLPRSEKNLEDIDTEAEDHLYDVIRYKLNRKIPKITEGSVRLF